MLRLLVAGTRYATLGGHRAAVAQAIIWSLVAVAAKGDRVLVHGDAPGVDQIAADLAREWGWRVEPHRAEWGLLGKAAGPRRNTVMVNADADLVVAFPAVGTRSVGTWDLVTRAAAAGIRVDVRPIRVEVPHAG